MVGNESADCDSIVSSIVYSLMCGAKAVPVVNGQRKFVELRDEVRVALSFAGLDFLDLIYFEEICCLGCPVKVFLVDHNVPSAQWSRIDFVYEVVGIIDHHSDGHLFTDCRVRVIRECASCISLIIDCFEEIPQELHKMLLTVFTFDTVNWTYRVTDFDVLMAGKLMNCQVGLEALRESECKDIFKLIESQSSNEAMIEPSILLHKDFKLYNQANKFYGISVLHIDLLDIDGLQTIVNELMLSECLQLHIILSAIRRSGGYDYYQQMAIAATHHDSYTKVVNQLRHPLNLIPKYESDVFGVFQQLNLEVARKKLQPMIQSILQK